MLIVRNSSSINGIPDPGIRDLVNHRFSQILSGEPYDYGQHGYMIVVESTTANSDGAKIVTQGDQLKSSMW